MNWHIRRSGVQDMFLTDGSWGHLVEEENCVVVHPGRIGSYIYASFILGVALGIIWLIAHWIANAQYFDAAVGAFLGAGVLFLLARHLRRVLSAYLWVYDEVLPEKLNIGDNITRNDIQRVILTETWRDSSQSCRLLEVGLQVVGRRDFVSLKRTGRRSQSDWEQQIELGKRLAERWQVEYKDLKTVLENKQFDKRFPLPASCFWDNWPSQDAEQESPNDRHW